LAEWGAQNVTPAPPLLDLGLGYGLVGLLAIVGAWIIARRDKQNPKLDGEYLVLLWAVTTVALVYLPFDLQRRLINGLHIPLCILAAIGLSRWLANKTTYRRLLTNIVITVGALGTLFVWGIPLIGVLLQPPTASQTTALFFLRQEEVVVLEWLRENTSQNDVILASPRLGMFVPGQTGARTFYGHPFETIEAEDKKVMVEQFYRGEIETISPPVDFIIYGPSEQALGQPKNLTEYSVVFSTKDVVIYK
jgi:hypothetical protein